jgi:hypothetical protein
VSGPKSRKLATDHLPIEPDPDIVLWFIPFAGKIGSASRASHVRVASKYENLHRFRSGIGGQSDQETNNG